MVSTPAKSRVTKPASTWDKNHDLALIRSLIQLILSNRPTLYTTPDLSDFTGNGGDKINKKIRTQLAKLTAGVPGAETIIEEEVAKSSRGGKRKSEGDAAVAAKTISPKKRKGKVEVDELEEGEAEEAGEVDH